jgi:hypothetical protein
MAGKPSRAPGTIVSLDERREARARRVLAEASRHMADAEHALFEAIRHEDRLRRRRNGAGARGKKTAGQDRKQEARVLYLRRGRAA